VALPGNVVEGASYEPIADKAQPTSLGVLRHKTVTQLHAPAIEVPPHRPLGDDAREPGLVDCKELHKLGVLRLGAHGYPLEITLSHHIAKRISRPDVLHERGSVVVPCADFLYPPRSYFSLPQCISKARHHRRDEHVRRIAERAVGLP